MVVNKIQTIFVLFYCNQTGPTNSGQNSSGLLISLVSESVFIARHKLNKKKCLATNICVLNSKTI